MRSAQLLTILVSFAALSVAAPPQEEEHHVHVLKRGEPLTARDLELAEMHEVNTTEMFKHSVIKRRGEEEVTIWVDNSFSHYGPEPEPEDSKRALQIKHPYNLSGGANRQQCFRVTHNPDTGPTAPCTGGIQEIRDWARNTAGFFMFAAATTDWRTMVVAGSNSGCNGRFRGQRKYAGDYSEQVRMGNVDLHNIVQSSLNRFSQVRGGRERVRAYGTADCGEYQTPLNWQIRRWGRAV